MKKIRIHNKDFEVYLTAEQIKIRLQELALQLQNDLQGKEIVFLAVLNGAFIFASDLVRLLSLDCRITFVKIASYRGVNSTGEVQKLIGLNEELEGKCVVILEDIIDSGLSMDQVVEMIRHEKPSDIKIVSLLFKPDAFRGSCKPDYTGFSIPNKFVIGYGLDYDGLGRNLGQIYILSD